MRICSTASFDVMHTIQLSPEDNIVVLTRSAAGGSEVLAGGRLVSLPVSLGLGHKLAGRAIRQGEKIIKYGAPIGSATRDIEAGAHVHLHNMKSDYLPTFTLETEHTFHKTS